MGYCLFEWRVLSPALLVTVSSSLTHFIPMAHIYTPVKRQKTIGFLTFSGGYTNVTLD